MEYMNIINQIIILFLIIIVGFIAGKNKIISQEANVTLSKILLNITLPFLIISAFNFDFSKNMLKTAVTILIISIFVHGTLSIVSLILYKKQEEGVRKVLRFITIFSNCGFIGYPVAGSIYGSEGIFYAAIYNVGFNIFVWTIGILIFQSGNVKGKGLLRKVFINPGIISVSIGMTLFVFSIKLPYVISETIKLIGNITIPLSMIIVGVSLCGTSLKSAFKEGVYYYASFFRLVLVPLVVYFILTLFKFKGIYLGIPLIVSAMPAAANTVTFAQIYNGDVSCATKITIVSTIFSAITLPLMVLLLK
ncbi:AEC family transporter [Clostridium cylindrosporum]|uniref:Auxin efflux carrier family protein n=1 Tax=Clostridium cylindrosporum DSM 605 TaxID=1121307 RepID=A0A0J8D5F3_CLOCY|nr:AEC family transporter [Clostridium cylindrosporum]KMT21047.1 auxin efflux carrier family protein [Clostridium cylindrosporum DSM 605]